MRRKKYQCHDCGDETKIIQSHDQTSNTYSFIIQCLNCGYEAGLFDTIEDAEMVIKCNSQGCNKRNECQSLADVNLDKAHHKHTHSRPSQ